MANVNVHEAKTHLSRLLQRAAAGEEIVIAKNGRPVARLVAVQPSPQRVFGTDRGVFEVGDDFNAPLDEELLREFER